MFIITIISIIATNNINIIIVSDNGKDWFKRHYAGCVDGEHYAWNEGRTSWSSNPSNKITWEYMKEYVEPDENKI